VFDLACRHVAEGERPVLYAWRYEDGMFGFNCGYDDHPKNNSYVPLCRECTVEKMPEFRMLRELEPGNDASRDAESNVEWKIGKMPTEEDEQ
jgi:hypothetical protein